MRHQCGDKTFFQQICKTNPQASINRRSWGPFSTTFKFSLIFLIVKIPVHMIRKLVYTENLRVMGLDNHLQVRMYAYAWSSNIEPDFEIQASNCDNTNLKDLFFKDLENSFFSSYSCLHCFVFALLFSNEYPLRLICCISVKQILLVKVEQFASLG